MSTMITYCHSTNGNEQVLHLHQHRVLNLHVGFVAFKVTEQPDEATKEQKVETIGIINSWLAYHESLVEFAIKLLIIN